MQLVCKDSKHQKAMVKMLESGNKEKNFFFLDPGNATKKINLGQNFKLADFFDRLISNSSCGCHRQQRTLWVGSPYQKMLINLLVKLSGRVCP